MKKNVFTLLMLCAAVAGRAQVTDQQSAILQVGDNATIYYGADALKEAVAAAPDRGGVITLTPGTFNAPEITKCVNIYGAGWVTDLSPKNSESPLENSILPTKITGNMTINLAEGLEAPHNLRFEGLSFDKQTTVSTEIDGLEFWKCSGANVSFSVINYNVTFTQCVMSSVYKVNQLLVQNCYIGTIDLIRYDENSTVIFNHCLVNSGYTYGGNTMHYQSDGWFYFFNCMSTGYQNRLKHGYYRNCMMNMENLDGWTGSTENFFSINYSTIFKDAENANYSDARTFELKDELKGTYIGSDGTEIGINGGNYPWDKTPHTPLVKDLKLAIDGQQLKVTYTTKTR